MADKYLVKVGIDFDSVQFSKISGMISDQLSTAGEVSKEFSDKALATAKKYNEEINKQKKTIEDINKKLLGENLDPHSKQMLLETRDKSKGILHDYQFGNASKGMDSKEVVDAMASYSQSAQSTSSMFDNLRSAGSTTASVLGKLKTGVLAAVGVISKFAEEIGKALKELSELSNNLNPTGAFGSQGQRDIMTRYGMSGNQAMGFKSSLDAMGMQEGDIGKMTSEQSRVFNSLQSFWNDGMGKLDPDAMDRYTKTMSDYQEMQAKFQMGLQMTVMKLVSSSPKFNEFVGKIGDLLESVLDFLGSPVVQAVFDGLVDFLTSVVTILEKAMKFISKLPAFGGANANITNNTSNKTNNNFNMYGNNFQSNDELARQLSYSNQGNYGG